MNANSGALAPAIPWQDRPSSMTLAAELLGVPSVSNGFTAKVCLLHHFARRV